MMLIPKLFVAIGGTTAAAFHASAFAPQSVPISGRQRSASHSPLRLLGKTPMHATTKSFPSRSSLAPRRSITSLCESPSGENNNAEDVVSMESNDSNDCWNPDLRKQIAAISSLGLLETAYLTYDKIQYSSSGGKSSSLVSALCSADSGASSCNDVLHGPYASLHLGGLDVPLSSLGIAAYTAVLLLATLPLLSPEKNDESGTVLDGGNRIALLGGTTLMASFSIYLVSLLVGVMHTSCLFCFASAGLSFSMAALSWFGGMLPSVKEINFVGDKDNGVVSELLDLRKQGVTVGASAVGLATVMALALFLGVSDDSAGNYNTLAASTPASPSSGTLLASTDSKSFKENVPPLITTTSSASALTLASDLKSLNSRMFGAFWCSHCYDQKQTLGYDAMQSIPYIECDREGYNNKRDMCKKREVPGYPTWEIGGKLFPGERSLEELREIVDDVKSGM